MLGNSGNEISGYESRDAVLQGAAFQLSIGLKSMELAGASFTEHCRRLFMSSSKGLRHMAAMVVVPNRGSPHESHHPFGRFGPA